MALIIYHEHTVVSTAICEENSGKWKCVANITWNKDGDSVRQSHFIKRDDELFSRFEDAVHAGLEAAKNWVDGKLNSTAFSTPSTPFALRPSSSHQPKPAQR